MVNVKPLESFRTLIICLQCLHCVNVTITLTLFLTRWWNSSIKAGSTVQPTFCKMDGIFVLKFWATTCRVKATFVSRNLFTHLILYTLGNKFLTRLVTNSALFLAKSSLTHSFPLHHFTLSLLTTVRFSDVFKGKRKSTLGANGLNLRMAWSTSLLW